MPKREGWVNVYTNGNGNGTTAGLGGVLGQVLYASREAAVDAPICGYNRIDTVKIEWFEPDPKLPMVRYVIREHGKTGSDGWFTTKEEAEFAMRDYRGEGDWYVAKQTTEHC